MSLESTLMHLGIGTPSKRQGFYRAIVVRGVGQELDERPVVSSYDVRTTLLDLTEKRVLASRAIHPQIMLHAGRKVPARNRETHINWRDWLNKYGEEDIQAITLFQAIRNAVEDLSLEGQHGVPVKVTYATPGMPCRYGYGGAINSNTLFYKDETAFRRFIEGSLTPKPVEVTYEFVSDESIIDQRWLERNKRRREEERELERKWREERSS